MRPHAGPTAVHKNSERDTMKPLFATAAPGPRSVRQPGAGPIGHLAGGRLEDDRRRHKQERSTVRISEVGGVLMGKIEKITDPTKQTAKCDECEDDRKGQPIIGMPSSANVKKNSGDTELWDGGDILDPSNGKVYRVRLKPVDGGKKLEVRGFIGMPLLGRTQTWIRVE
ncbi:hypothetical protein Ddc_23250 [Ditylenchus destructor]|nr:hypothetical protein Ddc_23250 [Ditylenchus destructor]